MSASSIKTSCRRSVFDKLSVAVKPRLVKRRHPTPKKRFTKETRPTVLVNSITHSQSRSEAGVETKPLPQQNHRPKNRTLAVYTLDEAAVESLYERLLRAKKIQPIKPPAYPEQVNLTSH